MNSDNSLYFDDINMLYASKYFDDLYNICTPILKYLCTMYDKNNIKVVSNISSKNIEIELLQTYIVNYNYDKIYIDLTLLNSDLVFDEEQDTEDTDKYSHANMLLIDNINGEIIRFEPHGYGTSCPGIDIKLKNIARNIKYTYVRPREYQHKKGPQTIQNNITILGKNCKNTIPHGTCYIWCIYFIHYCCINDNNDFVTNYLNFYDEVKSPINATSRISGYITYVCNMHNVYGPKTRSYKSIDHNNFIKEYNNE